MPPKLKKDVQALPVEDFTQDVLLVSSVQDVNLKLGLQAAAELLAPETLADATAAPAMHIELVHNNAAPVASNSGQVSADYTLPITMEHKFRLRKGQDIIDRLINSTFEVRLCNSQTQAVLASTDVDLLPFGLGITEIQDSMLQLQPAEPTGPAEVFKILQGSSLALCIRLMHQPSPTPPASAVSGTSAASQASTPSSNTAGTATPVRISSAQTPIATAGATAVATAPGPVLERFMPISAEEAADCNVLEFVPLAAATLPQQLLAALRNANGCLSFDIGLRLPTSGDSGKTQAVLCTGGSLADEQLAWNKRNRAFLTPAAVQVLKKFLETDQPVLLEVARYLTGATETMVDPAFSNYHALLQLEAANEQLQEPGSLGAVGFATAVGCMSWAMQQGSVADMCLPTYTQPPPNPRFKPIEEAPLPPTDSQPPVCVWLAAGTRFAIKIRLAKPLYPPWQPPARPVRQLADIVPARPKPFALPPPTAADRFRAKVQEIACQLAQEYATAGASSVAQQSSSYNGSNRSSGLDAQVLVFELNRSGRYLAMKGQLKQLLVEVVQERYKTTRNVAPVQAQQLYNDLYVHLTDELRKVMAGLAASKQPDRAARPEMASHGSKKNVAEVDRLLWLAVECEAAGDSQRGHELHQRRLLLLESADAWCEYGSFCMRVRAHVRAEAAFREALSLDQQHHLATAALMCLALAKSICRYVQSEPESSSSNPAEVLGHSLKDAAVAAAGIATVVPWALLAFLYRIQGKPKESQARSCHQEVVRQSKAAMAAATASSISSVAGSSATLPADDVVAGADAAPSTQLTGHAPAAANGYLAAAELALQLKLPGLASQLLELAAGLKDPAGWLTKRLKLAAIAAAQQASDSQKALRLLRELSEQLRASGREEDIATLHVLMGDVQYEAGNLTLAKQHYRRAMQKCPEHCPPRLYMRLGSCFMASGDARVAADVYSSCLDCSNRTASSSGAPGSAVRIGEYGVVEVGGKCASAWLGLGVASYHQGEYRSAEFALSEANLCDPEHPTVWSYLALLSLAQGKESDADQALTQAQRHGISNAEVLAQLGEAYQQLGRFGTATALLGKAAESNDTVQVRCKLAAVLLAQHDYEGCQRHLAAGAQLPASEADKQLLVSVLQKLQVAWPHL